jgi:serine/threonine protein kinase
MSPANLLLDVQGLLLADFGVSLLLPGDTHASLHYYAGTPLYTAPEQWLEQPRPASDQYTLAATCYHLLTRRPPFTGSLYAVMHGHLQVPAPPPDVLNPLIPPEVAAALQRATPAFSHSSMRIARLWSTPQARTEINCPARAAG